MYDYQILVAKRLERSYRGSQQGVAPLLVGSSSRQRREPYLKVTPKQKAIVGKYAAEHGPTKAIRKYSKDFDQTLEDCTVRGWKKACLKELHLRKKSGSSMVCSK